MRSSVLCSKEEVTPHSSCLATPADVEVSWCVCTFMSRRCDTEPSWTRRLTATTGVYEYEEQEQQNDEELVLLKAEKDDKHCQYKE